MATDAELHVIAESFEGVSRGKYWDDPAAYLLSGRGGRGFVMRRAPMRQEGVVDAETDEPFEDLIVVSTATVQARDEALRMFPDVVFTIPHFRRHTAVLAHLDRIEVEQLQDLLDLAYRSKTE